MKTLTVMFILSITITIGFNSNLIRQVESSGYENRNIRHDADMICQSLDKSSKSVGLFKFEIHTPYIQYNMQKRPYCNRLPEFRVEIRNNFFYVFCNKCSYRSSYRIQYYKRWRDNTRRHGYYVCRKCGDNCYVY